MPGIPIFHPNQVTALDVRLRQIENYLSRLHQYVKSASQTALETFQTELTISEASGSSGGWGISWSRPGGSGDAKYIQGEPIDSTAPTDGDILTYDTAIGEWSIRQWVNGRLGIATGAAATARLQIAAGTATLSPLKLTSGTDLTTPESGAVEYDGTRLEFTPTSIRKYVGLTSAHVTSTTTVSNTVTPTAVFTGAIPANSLAVGQTYQASVRGRYSTANPTDTVQLDLRVGPVTVFTLTSTAASVTDAPIMIDFAFTVRSLGAAGTAWGFVEAEMDAVNKTQASNATFTLNTTVASDVTIVATWSAAAVANSLSVDMGWLSQWG